MCVYGIGSSVSNRINRVYVIFTKKLLTICICLIIFYILITTFTTGHKYNHSQIQDFFKYFKHIHALRSISSKKMISQILLISSIISNFKIYSGPNFLIPVKTIATGTSKGSLGIYLKKINCLCSILNVYGNG